MDAYLKANGKEKNADKVEFIEKKFLEHSQEVLEPKENVAEQEDKMP